MHSHKLWHARFCLSIVALHNQFIVYQINVLIYISNKCTFSFISIDHEVFYEPFVS